MRAWYPDQAQRMPRLLIVSSFRIRYSVSDHSSQGHEAKTGKNQQNAPCRYSGRDRLLIVQTLLRVHPNHCLPEGSLPSIYYTRKRLFRQRLFHAKPADALSVRCRKSKDVFVPTADSVKKLDNSETLGYNMKQLQKFKQHVKRRTPYEHTQ